jgi:hypothetical protein
MRPQPLPGVPDAGFVARFLAGLPPELAGSFDRRQLFAIAQAFGTWDGAERRRGLHMVLPLPWGRYRISLSPLDARDSRSAARRRAAMTGVLAGVAAGAILMGGILLLMG